MHHPPPPHTPQGDEAWRGSTEPSGALHALLQEQDGDLCGPRPARMEPIDGFEQGLGMLPTNVPINSGQLLALLKEMGATIS